MTREVRPRVVVVGAGFGGLWAARALDAGAAQVLLVDHNNYHTFFPLLYQVAAAELSPTQIVNPVRSVLRKLRHTRFLLADVQRVDPQRQLLLTGDGQEVPYSYLILAAGSAPYYFGIPGAQEYAFPLRTLEHGVALRNHIIQCFERAVAEDDAEARTPLLRFVITGGGPTGVEFCGALQELIAGPLRRDYPQLNFDEVQVVLIDAGKRLVASLPERLSAYILKRLQRMGIEVRLETQVSRIEPHAVHLSDGESIAAETVVWTAGLQGHPLAKASGIPTGHGGQIEVAPTLQLPGYPNIYVVGDQAGVSADGRRLPMIAPVAMQQGEAAARNVLRQIAGLEPRPFVYKDPGMLAVVGRNAAVADLGRLQFAGFPAWLLWIGVHLFQLIGFRNRLQVLINWAWAYLFQDRAIRVILPGETRSAPARGLTEAEPPGRPAR